MKKRLLYILLTLIILIGVIFIQCSRNYSDACDAYVENGIKGKISNEINENIAEYLGNNRIKYADITSINYSPEGKIASVTVDSAYLNIVSAELSKIIYSSIDNSENIYGIPIGNIFGSKLLSGKGPAISVEVVPIGSVVHTIESRLLSGGINQTLHRITVNFNVVINCLAPFNETQSSLTTEIVIAEAVIIGEVPNVLLSPAG